MLLTIILILFFFLNHFFFLKKYILLPAYCYQSSPASNTNSLVSFFALICASADYWRINPQDCCYCCHWPGSHFPTLGRCHQKIHLLQQHLSVLPLAGDSEDVQLFQYPFDSMPNNVLNLCFRITIGKSSPVMMRRPQ